MRSASLIGILAFLEMQLDAYDVAALLAASHHHHHELPKTPTLGVIYNIFKPINGGKRRHPRILKKIIHSNKKKARRKIQARTPRRKV
jgi:hypothetical protein